MGFGEGQERKIIFLNWYSFRRSDVLVSPDSPGKVYQVIYPHDH